MFRTSADNKKQGAAMRYSITIWRVAVVTIALIATMVTAEVAAAERSFGTPGYTEAQLADMYGLTGKTHSAVTPVRQRADFMGGRYIPRHQKTLDRLAKGNVDLIFIGDSITHQWEREGQKLWDKYYAPRNAVNIGVVGDRTQHVLWRLNNGEIDGISPKLAVVMIGTNNCKRNDNTAEEIADGIKAICAKVRYKLPKTKILLLAIFPRGAGPSPERIKNAKASELASQIADNKMVYYLNIKDEFLDSNDRLIMDAFSDGTHPNAKGYKIWAEAIEPMVAQLMEKK
jgi:beta-glucosidase